MVRPIGEVGRVAGERAIGPRSLPTLGAAAKLIECRLRVSLVIPPRESAVNLVNNRYLWTGVTVAAVTIVVLGSSYAQQGPRGRSSYAPVDITEPFSAILARLSAQLDAPRADRSLTKQSDAKVCFRLPYASDDEDRLNSPPNAHTHQLYADTTKCSSYTQSPITPPARVPAPSPSIMSL
jgi:hypothetical protein